MLSQGNLRLDYPVVFAVGLPDGQKQKEQFKPIAMVFQYILRVLKRLSGVIDLRSCMFLLPLHLCCLCVVTSPEMVAVLSTVYKEAENG